MVHWLSSALWTQLHQLHEVFRGGHVQTSIRETLSSQSARHVHALVVRDDYSGIAQRSGQCRAGMRNLNPRYFVDLSRMVQRGQDRKVIDSLE